MPKMGSAPKIGELKVERLFCYLYERYYEKIFDNAFYYLGAKEGAEDAVQDVFLKVWENLPALQAKISDWYDWQSFLFVLLRNKAINLKKARSREANCKDYLLTTSSVLYDDEVLAKECNFIFMRAVESLAYRQREIFILNYYRFKSKVIANEMNVTVKTVSNTLGTARKLLSNYVTSEFEIDETKLANMI